MTRTWKAHKVVLALGLMALLLFIHTEAFADCTSPARAAGTIIYNEAQNVPQVCVGSTWVALGDLNPSAGGGSCSNPTRTEGAIVYNIDHQVLQYCDGTNWIAVQAAVTGGPSGCADIGDLCADGTVFAGYHPLTQLHLFIPTTDQEQPGSPGTYTMDWKNATGTNDISTDSKDDGQINHTNRGGAIADFQAFQTCEDLSAGGHSDWYLPSLVELYNLWGARDTINTAGNITDFQNNIYWSSTEYNTGYAWAAHFTDGKQDTYDKTFGYRVRCVRQ